ncbi:hydrolase [Salmonella enterica subsp. enterica serovar Typhi]|nr:hydrolase [Salmonella enterica subsp. enterica serovar Typhi]
MSSKIFCKSWGAEYIAADVVRFRLWATGQQKVMLRLAGKDQEMQASGDGWFTLDVSGVTPGTEYNFVLSDGMVLPDPASRAQKTDVNGPSYVIDPGSYAWRNTGWKGSRWEQAVVYEMHTGTFTPEGTFHTAIAKLPYLAELGVTVIEVMPVAQFGGERGWGYDGVLLYAPHSAYGTPDDFKAFIDTAHGYGLSVILDIVLNHFGPEGNYLPLLAPAFFHKERMTPWGNGIAYDVDAVRRYIIEAPLYWLTEYHLDGLRFDAIDQIEDSSARHVLVEIAQRIREDITDRPIHLTTEDSRNIISLHPRDQDGNAPLFTAEWNDDFHNAVHVFATGETQAYYNDFADAPEKHLARALAEGFAYQGEISPQTGEPRGVKSTGQPPVAFVDFIQNHDQVGNRAQGDRLITLAGAERTKVLLATLLLSPHIPLLFMGEEYGESRPFLFFTDFHGDLARAVREGRAKEFADHAGENVPDPNAPETFHDNYYPLAPATWQGREAEILALTDKAAIADLHERQPWKLMSWRDAARSLSYRRFFEVTGLVGMRVEDKIVFDDTHRLILELVRTGAVDGLRIDHIDGLADPKAYLARLRQEVGPACYITVEKILAKGEQLPDDWPVSGTTGYEFIASLAEVLVDDKQIDNLRQAYETVTGAPVDMRAELRAAKLLMVDRNFEGEFTRLLALALSIASELQIAQEESVVRQALRELLIAFPVYRTYGTAEGLPPTDICLLHRIVERVKTLENPPQPEALTFLSRLLTGDVPVSSQEEATQFRVRFQQLTGPLMAKSVEDTLFFRQNMGLALNEVGAEPVTHHFSIERFHHEMKTRQARQPDALSGTSTHDTKRGEDARARLYTLTEAPEQWSECLARWRQMNQTHVKFLNDGTAPKSADTWMLYQALTGVWPPMLQPQDETGLNALKIRFEAFVEKALREAKLRTDWVDSNEAYETAMLDYARYLLAPDNQTFLQDFYRSLQPFIRAGLVNSLTQTVIKLTAPGVPDIYQGSEALNFSLVDPDNRREPDFATLAQQLDQLTPGVFSREESWLDGQVNQYATAALLRLRQQNHELFRFGDYIPLRAVGQRADKVIAYARVNHDDALIVVAPRLVFAECDGLLSQSHSGFWSGTDIIIPGQLNQRRYRNVLTQERLMPGERLSLASHQGGVLVLMSD